MMNDGPILMHEVFHRPLPRKLLDRCAWGACLCLVRRVLFVVITPNA